MAEHQAEPAARDMVGRLEQAINQRDLEGLVQLFSADVVVEYPAHPSGTFQGRDQIWRNWAPIMAKLDDFRATVVRSAVDDNSVWVEWLWQGTQADGSPCPSVIVKVQRPRIEEIMEVDLSALRIVGG